MSASANTPSDAPPSDGRRRLILVTGLSGSGKSTAAKSLEDIGYYCVDNLPLPLLRTFLKDPFAQVGEHVRRVAVVVDMRAHGFAETMPEILSEIDADTYDFTLLFIDSAEDSLVRRFSETRRSHPLATTGDRPLIEGIRRERELLAEIRGAADLVFDSSDWSVHDLRRAVYREFGAGCEGPEMVVSLLSFGFKHGLPMGSDLVLDVRFLPNPYFLPALREKTGCDAEIRDFLEGHAEYRELLDRLEDFLTFLLPRYRRENRSYLSVAIGCTGGRHRSVSIVEHLAKRFGGGGEGVRIRSSHRDLDR